MSREFADFLPMGRHCQQTAFVSPRPILVGVVAPVFFRGILEHGQENETGHEATHISPLRHALVGRTHAILDIVPEEVQHPHVADEVQLDGRQGQFPEERESVDQDS
jgi:hypothetical protein